MPEDDDQVSEAPADDQQAAIDRERQEQEAPAAEKERQEQEAAAAAAAEKEREEQDAAAAAEKARQEQEAAAAEKERQEQDAATAVEKAREEQDAAAAAAEKARQEQEAAAAAEKERQEQDAAAAAEKERQEQDAAAAAEKEREEQRATAAQEAEAAPADAEPAEPPVAVEREPLVDSAAEPAPASSGTAIAAQAEQLANDYRDRGVTYQMGADASSGGARSDCSHYVHDVLQRAGLDVEYVDTQHMAGSDQFAAVTHDELQAGDVLVQGHHMGVYSGDNDNHERPLGWQMGNHGAAKGPFGPGGWFANPDDLRFYRPRALGAGTQAPAAPAEDGYAYGAGILGTGSDVSWELADAPSEPVETSLTGLSRPEMRVLAWLRLHADEIAAAEREYNVDRRAIAGAVAWEALMNTRWNLLPGFVRASAGPGKIHYRHRSHKLLNQVEDQFGDTLFNDDMPRPSNDEERAELLKAPATALRYIAAIMNAGATVAEKFDVKTRRGAFKLCWFFNTKDLDTWEKYLQQLDHVMVPGNDLTTMGAWVAVHDDFLEDAVGHTELPVEDD